MAIGTYFPFSLLLILACYFGRSSPYTCPGISGNLVDWWIVFQQKSMPFFHSYVDSTNNQNISFHFPERQHSVLSRVMDAIIVGSYPQYVVYSNDLMNVKEIAADLHIPTPLKWMHGILALDSSPTSGIWLLHNNLYFPPTKSGEFVSPGDDFWYSTTVGDTFDNVFYACLSLVGETQVLDAISNILAGNPVVLKSYITNIQLKQRFLTTLFFQKSTFSLEESALTFTVLNVLNLRQINDFDRGTNTIVVTTRSRGLLKRGQGICYNANAASSQDFISLEKSYQDKKSINQMETMFVLSEDPISTAYGVACFGQDIAGYTEIVTIMICINIQGLHTELLKLSKISTFQCSSPNPSNRHRDFSSSKVIGSKRLSSVNGPENVHPAYSIAESVDNENPEATQSDQENTEIGEPGTCISKTCHTSNDEFGEEDGTHFWRNPVLKLEKLSNKYNELTNHLTTTMDGKEKFRKNKKIQDKQRPVIKVQHKRDVDRYIWNAQTSKLALFCQRSCKHCRSTEIEFQGMSNDFDPSIVQFLWVDATLESLPSSLKVPYTPLFRFYNRKTGKWTTYNGEHKMLSILEFLHSGLNSSNKTFDDGKEMKHTDIGILYNIRTKRNVHQNFITKHVVAVNEDELNQPSRDHFVAKFDETIMWRMNHKQTVPNEFTQSYLVGNMQGTVIDSIDEKVNDVFKFDNVNVEVCHIMHQACQNHENLKPSVYNKYFMCTFNLNELIPGGKVVNVKRNNANDLMCQYTDMARVTLGIGKRINMKVLEVNHFFFAKSTRMNLPLWSNCKE